MGGRGSDGMVIAVQTSGEGRVSTDYRCDGNVNLAVDPGDARRATLAAILQAGWGVAETGAWGAVGNKAQHKASDSLWQVGDTPFGAFSRSLRLAFPVRDAAARNSVRAAMDALARRVASAVGQFGD